MKLIITALQALDAIPAYRSSKNKAINTDSQIVSQPLMVGMPLFQRSHTEFLSAAGIFEIPHWWTKPLNSRLQNQFGASASRARVSGPGWPSTRIAWMQTWVAPALKWASMRSRILFSFPPRHDRID
jgi:hypothetical protein